MKFFATIVVASFALTAALAFAPYRDEKIAKEPRIVGGQQAERDQFPYQCAMLVSASFFCGCSIINNDTVLTAAHCVRRLNDSGRVAEILLGAWDLLDTNETRQRVTTDLVFVHEEWQRIGIRNDIALINLKTEVDFSLPTIETIDLPSDSSDSPVVGDMVTISGWGQQADDDPGVARILRYAVVPVISDIECAKTFGNDTITEAVGCVNTTGGTSTCSGDSGGPAAKDGKVYGITSFGSGEGCELGYPAAFTNVAYYLDWIYEHIQILRDIAATQ